ncbi:MAG: hypothetical protein KME59_14915 [Trichormus sp. ATA11-4-KO1]|jgi:hypothetical protein|nr:hypothetical protein [Trichormus sp. ATA11-4-KO1]
MFGFIKKLITNILGFITGLLPGKKSNSYYLELDEPAAEKSPAAKPKEVSPAVAAKPAATSNGTKAAVAVAVTEPVESASAKSNAPITAKTAKAPKAAKVEASKNGKAPAATTSIKEPTETTFAPKYLAPSATGSNGRRRPGANMSTYLDMARQVKTPG